MKIKEILSCYLCNSHRGLEQIWPFYREENQELNHFPIADRLQTAVKYSHSCVHFNIKSGGSSCLLFSISIFNSICYHKSLDIRDILFYFFSSYSISFPNLPLQTKKKKTKVKIAASVLIYHLIVRSLSSCCFSWSLLSMVISLRSYH